MVFHGRSGELSTSSWSGPARIRRGSLQLAYEGAQDVSLDAQGALQLRHRRLGTMRDAAPVTWQETEAGREPVTAGREDRRRCVRLRHRLLRSRRAADVFYRDPLYSTLFGGVGGESLDDMVMGADGSLYLAGSILGTRLRHRCAAV